MTLVGNKEDALKLIASERLDYILSDVNFPSMKGERPRENIEDVMREALEANVPVCFVTKADHHGLLEKVEEGYVAVKALTLGKLAQSLGEMSDGYSFRKVRSEKEERPRAEAKTPEMWRNALALLQNAVAESKSPVDRAIRQVAEVTGFSFRVRPGERMALISVPKRKLGTK